MSKSENKLRLFRKRSGYSEQQVAEFLGIKDPATISRWENGETMPNSLNLLVMCHLYGVKLAETYPALYRKSLKEIRARLRILNKKADNK